MERLENPWQWRRYLLGQAHRPQAMTHAFTPHITRKFSRLRKMELFSLVAHVSSRKIAVLTSIKHAAARLEDVAKVAHGVTSNTELKHLPVCSLWEGSCTLIGEVGYSSILVKGRLY